MYSLNVGLVIGSTDLVAEVIECLSTLPIRVVLEQREIGEHAAFIEKLERVQPDVVLLGYQLVADNLSEAIAQIKSTAGAPMVILVNSSAATQHVLLSMRSGADEFVYPPLREDLTAALERIAASRAKLRAGTKPRGKVFAFLGTKGGSGTTTVACHVAVELHRQTNLQVLLADFDIDSGLVGFLMKSQARYTLIDALAAAHRLDPSLWKALVSNGHPGVEVLMAPPASGLREEITPQSYRYIVPFVRANYDWTVLDLGSRLTPAARTVIDEVDETFLVTTHEIPALHQTKQIIEHLLDSGYGQHRLHVLLNRTPRRLEVTLEELDRMLGVPVYATVPNDYPALYEAYANGTLLPAKSKLAGHFARVAARMAGLPRKERKTGFIF